MNKYILLFLICTIPYGLISTYIFNDLLIGISSGLFFGIVMTVILGGLHYFVGKNAAVNQAEKLLIPHPYEQAFNLVRTSIEDSIQGKLIASNTNTGVITAKTRMSWLSWGEKITISLEKDTDSTTNVWIQSKPFIRTTIVDYGKNKDNINKLVESLQ